jgi:hypothetical protein
MQVELLITDAPESMNKVGGHSTFWAYSWHKKKWQNLIGFALIEAKVRRPLSVPVKVSARIRFPTNRKRDEGNFRMMLEKAAGDMLVNGGYIADDTPDFYRFEAVEFEEERGDKRTILTLTTPEEEVPNAA